MTEEELKQEAEEYAEQCYGWCNNDQVTDVAIATYITSAEPREKRIKHLEESLLDVTKKSVKRIEELERKLKVETELSKRLGVAYREYEQLTKEQDEHIVELEQQLTKANELLKKMYYLYHDPCVTNKDLENRDKLFEEVKQIIQEIDK